MNTIFISLIHYKGRENTIQCLLSLQSLKKENFQIKVIVIDNKPDEPLDINPNDFVGLDIHIIKTEKNLGFAGGHNLGISYSLKHGGDYVLILNNDTFVDNSLLLELVKVLSFDEKIGIVVPKIYFAPGFEFHKNRYKKEDEGHVIWYGGGMMDWNNVIGHHKGVDNVDDNEKYDQIEDTDFATGAGMMIKKEVFEKVGKLDERYFLYYEDSDFSMRTRNSGFKIEFVPTALIWHKNAGSAGGSGSELQDYYITRNRLLFGMKYAPIKSKLALLRESSKLLIRGRKWQRRGVLDFYRRKFGKGSFPV